MATSPVAEHPLIAQRGQSAHPSFRDSRAGRIPLLALVFTIGLSLFVSVDPPRP